MRKRTRARELALQFLYSVDTHSEPSPPSDYDAFLRMQTRDDRIFAFARDLIAGCIANQAEIDAHVQEVADRWNLERLATVDRNVLRLGTFELLFRPDIPPQVSMNEWIELAKRFSTEKSGGFVNGLLDKIHRNGKSLPIPPIDLDQLAAEPDGDTDETSDEDDLPTPLD